MKIEITNVDQSIYDAFNGFILSNDLRVFGKLLARTLIFNQVKNIPGDIVECGVFKGTGLLSFLKLKRYFCPNSAKKVIGFDFFNSDDLIKTLSGHDKETMNSLFSTRNFAHNSSFAEQLQKLIIKYGFEQHEFELVAGDISKTALDFVTHKPGLKISLLYLDLDLDTPTYDALNTFWSRMSRGGIVVFDEYAYHNWSESNGVDRFFADKNITIQSLDYMCPTAYVIKD